MNEEQEQLDLRFASHLNEWRARARNNHPLASAAAAAIEALWDHTLSTQGRTQNDLSGRVLCVLQHKAR